VRNQVAPKEQILALSLKTVTQGKRPLEVRLAVDCAKRGVHQNTEYPTKLGDSSVDFRISSDAGWYVELVQT